MADDGGPFYPRGSLSDRNPPASSPGISMLDWFAGQAMVGIAGDFGTRLQSDSKSAANMAYCFAEAMVAEKRRREQTGDEPKSDYGGR